MRRTGRPISRSTPTVSRRSSTSMIVSASRNTVAATIVTTAMARWKRSSTRNGPAAPAASPAGSARTPGIRAFTSVANCWASSGSTSATLTEATCSAPAGHAGRPRHVQQVRQVQSHRSRDLPQPRRIGRRLVDTGDAELARVCSLRVGGEADHAADVQAFGFGQLAGDEHVGGAGLLCRCKQLATSDRPGWR